MSALHEKVLWPLVGIIIFAILAAFYIDDRRSLSQEKSAAISDKEPSNSTQSASSSPSTPSKTYAAKKQIKTTKLSGAETVTDHKGFSGSIDDYLAQSSNERSAELIAAAEQHQGYSGSINDYLSAGKTVTIEKKAVYNSSSSTLNSNTSPKQHSRSSTMEEYLGSLHEKRNDQLISAAKEHSGFTGSIDDYLSGKKTHTNENASGSNDQSTSMSMDEYMTKSGSQSGTAYHGSMEEYLEKYGSGTVISSKSEQDPFSRAGHSGFHGSYEEYAKKFN